MAGMLENSIPSTIVFKQSSIGKQDSTIGRKTWGRLNLYGVYFLLALLLNRCELPLGIYPVGVAFFLASLITVRKSGWMEVLVILAGSFLGILSNRGIENAIQISIILILVYGVVEIIKIGKKTAMIVTFTIITWAILKLILTGISNPSINIWAITGVEIVICTLLMLIFTKGFAMMASPKRLLSKYSKVALLLTIIFALCGTRELVFQSIKIMDVGIAVIIMIVSYLEGGGIGAAMGVCIGLITGIWSKDLITVALYSIPGLFGGFLRNFGKMGTVIGGLLGLAVMMLHQHFNLAFSWQSLPWGIGMATFLMVPKQCFSQLSNCFSVAVEQPRVSDEQKYIQSIILDRLKDLSEVFSELSKSFHEELQVQTKQTKMDLYSILDEVSTKNCHHCNGYEVCWNENFYSTYREIFDLIAYAELYGQVNAQQIKGKLAKTCFQQFKLLTTINQFFERCQNEFRWERKLNESKCFLVDQLQGVSNLISNLAQEIQTDVTFKYEVEEKLRYGFSRMGIMVKELTVLTSGTEQLEIRIRQASCNQKRECVYLAGAMISRLLGQEYSVWEKNCCSENNDCSYCLIPSFKYEMKTTVCKVPKDGNQHSGDNHSLHELKDGHFIAILSDGMGNGQKAALESNTTVSILDKLLAIGIDRNFAVKMINSVLLLHSATESFATVDLVQVDLYEGKAEFIKIGAATTYIKRGKDVWSIKSTSLPAGILNTVDIERTVIQLQPDDLIIMATDGVVDSKPAVPGKEEWLLRALKQVEVVGPEALGEYLLSLAKINYDGIPQDDMTVIVLQIQEKNRVF